MVKCLPEFEYLTVFLKNRNINSKIRRSKITDYAALSRKCQFLSLYLINKRTFNLCFYAYKVTNFISIS